MAALLHLCFDPGKMQVHRLRVAMGKDERRAFAFFRANRAGNRDRFRALTGWGRGTAASFGPPPCDLVLLAGARRAGEPDFYVAGSGALLLREGFQTGRETFLKSSVAPPARS